MKNLYRYSAVLTVMVMAMLCFTACGGSDDDISGDVVKTTTGVHRIEVTFSGNTTGWSADLMFTATLGTTGYSNIYEDNQKVNDSPGGWFVSGIRNYTIYTDAACDLMTLTLMVSSGGNKNLEPISVTLRGYVNNVQTNMKVIDYKPGDPRKSDMFAADNLDLSY